MQIKKSLGSIRRALCGSYDEITYRWWLARHDSTSTDLFTLSWYPLISIVVPTYNTDIGFFDAMIESVINQAYKNWELVLVDDKSSDGRVRDRIIQYAELDNRIRYIFLEKNQHIARATNIGIDAANGLYIGLLDHDDILHSNTLLEVVASLNVNKKLEFIYTDEDKIVNNRRIQPFFKPDLNIDMLHSINYITHFSVISKNTLVNIGHERHKYNGAQDWELFLRIIRNIPQKNIHHIPKVLYSWRIHNLSTAKDMEVKPYVLQAQEKAIKDDLLARGALDYQVNLDKKYRGQWNVLYGAKEEDTILYVQDPNAVSERQLKEYRFVAFIKGPITNGRREVARMLIGDASRVDVGVVITGLSRVIKTNTTVLLGKERTTLIQRFTHISFSKHIYKTVRYNLPVVQDYEIAVIEVSKIKPGMSIEALSGRLSDKGLRHLFVPYRNLI